MESNEDKKLSWLDLSISRRRVLQAGAAAVATLGIPVHQYGFCANRTQNKNRLRITGIGPVGTVR